MAELAVLDIAKSLLQQLSSPAIGEFKLWFNLEADLKKLKKTIQTINDVIHDAEQKKPTNSAIGGWLSRLQDEMYKADDLFDTISTRALKKKVISGNKIKRDMMIFFSKSNPLYFIAKTAHQVKELREQLDDIAKDKDQFGLIENDQRSQRADVKRNAQHSFITEDEVIGREHDKQELMRLLMASTSAQERVSVIAVVGIGGQGKTAIAQLLYNAEEIKGFFKLRLWALVNYFSDLKGVLEEITGTKSHSLDELQKRLRAKINGTKFLLVIDDVWGDIREQWLDLKRLLYSGQSGSKVLITTRSQTVAQNLATVRPCYSLGELSDVDGWILFRKMAFESNEREEDQTKEELGRQIYKKCPKVPLAIRTIGSFLFGKDKEKWSAFADNELMKEMPDRENIVMQVLKISYDDLPSSLKRCFAYCSLFPKDYEFTKTTLIHHWMAQDLLEISDANPCLEEVGESYFLYLVQRHFFQDVKVDEYDEIVSCKMHDLFHDLAVQIAAGECQAMLKVTDELGRKFPRHLLVKEINKSVLQCTSLRSLVCTNTEFVERTLLDSVLLNMQSLRTLSLRQLGVEEIPSSIGKLVHLKYLDLLDSKKLIKLPDAICKLQNLLILRLENCKNLVKLPDNLQKLISLRCLKIEGCYKLEYVPSGLEHMTSLVMLDRLIVHKDHGGLRCLKHLKNLRDDICIEFPNGGWKNYVADAEECMLPRKTKLSRLSILWKPSIKRELFPEGDAVLDMLQPSNNIGHLTVDSFPGVKFPNWISSLHNLVELTLEQCPYHGRCPELPQLHHLFQLKKLYLGRMYSLEYVASDTCSYGSGPFFPSLESLVIDNMASLQGWQRPKTGEGCGAYDDLWFPRLSQLQVRHSRSLTSLPMCPFVEALELCHVSVNLVTRLLRSPKLQNTGVHTHATTCSNIIAKLKSLSLSGIFDLVFLPDDFEKLSGVRHLWIESCPGFERLSLFPLLQNLPCLESLEFLNCDPTECAVDDVGTTMRGMPWRWLRRLKVLEFEFGSDALGGRLLEGLVHLTRLERLALDMNMVPNVEDMQWTAPPNLKHLRIEYPDKVVGLNRFIRQVKNLQSLELSPCGIDERELNKLPWEKLDGLRKLTLSSNLSMEALPQKCQHLLALEDLIIRYCPNIASLPDWVSRLTSLEIEGCAKLKEACRIPVGPCWPLIRDIPFRSIEDYITTVCMAFETWSEEDYVTDPSTLFLAQFKH